MKRIYFALGLAVVLGTGCHSGQDTPDVSGIKVAVKVERFDKDLFALDSTRLAEQWPAIQKKYPDFSRYFVDDVLALGPAGDDPSTAYKELRHFLGQNQHLKDTVWQKFPNMDGITAVLNNYFRYVKYYYPDYQVPAIITFIGNFADRETLTRDGLAIGLDFYMGPDFSFYQIPEVQEVFPSYVSRRFAVQYLPVNVMRAVLVDLYPTNLDTANLVTQLIDQGKRMYIVDKFLPGVNDTLKLGYTGRQYDWCRANEGLIWNFLVEQNVLYSFDQDVVKTYTGDAPSTQTMPAQSPGDIAAFVGWQIVKKYASRHGDVSPKRLMDLSARDILAGAQYNPK